MMILFGILFSSWSIQLIRKLVTRKGFCSALMQLSESEKIINLPEMLEMNLTAQ
jgi:hypothetical protein